MSKKCTECKRPVVGGKRNKDGELPYEIRIEITEEEIKGMRKGEKLIWFISDKRKLGYCEVKIELKNRRGKK